jgi:ABC-type multidrug transport system fused ATPase/permease subunit
MTVAKATGVASFPWLVSRYARPYALPIAGMLAFTLGGNVLTVVQPAILAAMLASLSGVADEAIPAGTSSLDLNYLGTRVSQWISERSEYDTLTFLALLFVGVSICAALLSYIAESLAVWLSSRLGRSIQMEVSGHLLEQDIAFFSRRKVGELIARVTADAVTTAQVLGPLIRRFVHYSVQMAAYAVYLLSTSAWLTVGAISLLVWHFGFTAVMKRPVRRLVREATDASARFLGALQESFTNIRVAKSFGAESFELTKLRAAADANMRSQWTRDRVGRLEQPVRSIFDALAVLAIFIIAMAEMRAGRLGFQGLILFIFVARTMIVPINQFATVGLLAVSAGASSERIRELLAERPGLVDGAISKGTFEQSLRIEHCSFSYGEGQAIHELTLDIQKGEFVALVGSSGAGKSTLADLILRLHDPQSGRILIDGVDVRTLKQRDYRRMFGVVSQESLLFHDSVRNNIRFGRDELTDETIEQAARVANAHHFIAALPKGYDTVVGDRGLRLSGGERQRIAIARAVVHNPQILILDEATSALDSESERFVQLAINQVVERTTAIVIAHRLSTITHADRIVVMSHGRIEAVGRHDQLVSTNAIYGRFCELQFERPAKAVIIQ